MLSPLSVSQTCMRFGPLPCVGSHSCAQIQDLLKARSEDVGSVSVPTAMGNSQLLIPGLVQLDLIHCTVLDKQATGMNSASPNPLLFTGLRTLEKQSAYSLQARSCLLPLCQVAMVTIVNLKMCAYLVSHWLHTFHVTCCFSVNKVIDQNLSPYPSLHTLMEHIMHGDPYNPRNMI